MKTVYKYPIQITGRVQITGRDRFVIEMPAGAKLLCVDEQFGYPQMWVLVDTTIKETTQRHFRFAGTGLPIDGEIIAHVGTYSSLGGTFIWHIFEVEPPEENA